MKVTVKEVLFKKLGGFSKFEVYVGDQYFGSADDRGQLIVLKTQAISFVEELKNK